MYNNSNGYLNTHRRLLAWDNSIVLFMINFNIILPSTSSYIKSSLIIKYYNPYVENFSYFHEFQVSSPY